MATIHPMYIGPLAGRARPGQVLGFGDCVTSVLLVHRSCTTSTKTGCAMSQGGEYRVGPARQREQLPIHACLQPKDRSSRFLHYLDKTSNLFIVRRLTVVVIHEPAQARIVSLLSDAQPCTCGCTRLNLITSLFKAQTRRPARKALALPLVSTGGGGQGHSCNPNLRKE
jgi:hypothetical protein